MIFATKLTAFEGPLDLLLHLIEKNKLDIYDIPISDITDQYLEYLNAMDEKDADIMSEFLVMAATLLDIKARMLLPKEDEEGEEEDPRAELVQQLLEYKLYKYMSYELKDKELAASRAMYRKESIPEEVAAYEAPIDLDRFLGDLTLTRLQEVFRDIMRRSSAKVNDEAMRYGRIHRDEIKIPDRMKYIRKKLKKSGEFSFRSLFDKDYDKMNVIVTFLAILELIRTGELGARQAGNDDDLILCRPELINAEE